MAGRRKKDVEERDSWDEEGTRMALGLGGVGWVGVGWGVDGKVPYLSGRPWKALGCRKLPAFQTLRQ